MNRYPHYETDDAAFPAEAYTAAGWGAGIAWYVYGWETEPDEDTEWSGYEVRTGRVVAVMVGDDRRFTFDPEDLSPLEREDYCGECGQVGCTHDGLDRSRPAPPGRSLTSCPFCGNTRPLRDNGTCGQCTRTREKAAVDAAAYFAALKASGCNCNLCKYLPPWAGHVRAGDDAAPVAERHQNSRHGVDEPKEYTRTQGA